MDVAAGWVDTRRQDVLSFASSGWVGGRGGRDQQIQPPIDSATGHVRLGDACSGRAGFITAGGCSPSQSSEGSSGGQAVHVRYESMHEGGESGGTPQLQDVVAQGDRFRMSISDAATPDDVYQTVVWDGEPCCCSRVRTPAGSRTRRPTSVRPRTSCAPVTRRSTRIVSGGDAAGLRPGGGTSGHGLLLSRARTPATRSAEAREITLDDETGLLLRSVAGSSRLVAVEVDSGAAVDETTFSTEIPSGHPRPGGRRGRLGDPAAADAADSCAAGRWRRAALADVRHGPSLVVIGELAGVTDVLGTGAAPDRRGNRSAGLRAAQPDPPPRKKPPNLTCRWPPRRAPRS